jgi:hypothetical protein
VSSETHPVPGSKQTHNSVHAAQHQHHPYRCCFTHLSPTDLPHAHGMALHCMHTRKPSSGPHRRHLRPGRVRPQGGKRSMWVRTWPGRSAPFTHTRPQPTGRASAACVHLSMQAAHRRGVSLRCAELSAGRRMGKAVREQRPVMDRTRLMCRGG